MGLWREDTEREQMQGLGGVFICSLYSNILGKASLLQEGRSSSKQGGHSVLGEGRQMAQGGDGGNIPRSGARGSTG